MKFTNKSIGLIGLSILGLITSIAYNNCSGGFSAARGGSGGSSGPSNFGAPGPGSTLKAPMGANVVSIALGGPYGNTPLVTVTICQPGTTNCATIPNVLLDSGSSGIRIFSAALSNSFTSAFSSNNAECISYGDNSVDWGAIVNADVTLGQETAHSVPIQIINSAFADGGKKCFSDLNAAYINNGFVKAGTVCPTTSTPASSQNSASPTYNCPYFDAPDVAFNGIVGVNFQSQDCGSACASNTGSGPYYTCTATGCSSAAMPVASQITNPVALMPTDNNGVMIEFPNVASSGFSANLVGYLVMGIGTQANNAPGAVTTLTADPSLTSQCYSYIKTTWGGSTICSFIDTGSQTLNFPNLSTSPIPVNPVSNAYDPASTTTYTATNIGLNAATSTVTFQIQNYDGLIGSTGSGYFPPGYVVGNVGTADQNGPINGTFDWGFPFFLGRTVFVGLEGKTSSLGTGFYWAY